jgi:hypothetical protein
LLFVLRCSMEGLYMICRSITNDQWLTLLHTVPPIP